MFGKIQMILMMKTSISNNRITRLKKVSIKTQNKETALKRNLNDIFNTKIVDLDES